VATGSGTCSGATTEDGRRGRTIATEEGWLFLLEIAAADDSYEDWYLPEVTGVVANLVTRGVVWMRLTDGVRIP